MSCHHAISEAPDSGKNPQFSGFAAYKSCACGSGKQIATVHEWSSV